MSARARSPTHLRGLTDLPRRKAADRRELIRCVDHAFAGDSAERLMQRGLAPDRLSVVGYGGERPVADNAIADGSAQNRRVDIVVLRGQP
jgi:hypothetical protein